MNGICQKKSQQSSQKRAADGDPQTVQECPSETFPRQHRYVILCCQASCPLKRLAQQSQYGNCEERQKQEDDQYINHLYFLFISSYHKSTPPAGSPAYPDGTA